MMKVVDYMCKNIVTVRPESTVKATYDIMIEKRFRHILITDASGVLLGILSDRDIKEFVSPFAGSKLETGRDKATLHVGVERIMIKDIVSVTANDSLKSCLKKMLEKAIHALPVIDEEKKVVGIITSTDMLKLLNSKIN